MSDQRCGGIAWTDVTWNPVRGCSRVSEGCRHCYAERVAARFNGPGLAYEGLAHRVGGEARWTGKVVLVPEHMDDPLHWRKPRRVFVNSMSDLFHEALSDEQIDRVFAVMALAGRHTFQVLTKRAARMRDYAQRTARSIEPLETQARALGHTLKFEGRGLVPWPLPNVWLGVSVEDQATADARIPLLLQTPAAVRWVSYEPALGPVDFDADECGWLRGWHVEAAHACGGDPEACQSRCPEAVQVENEHRLDWIVVGGESGPGARPFGLNWAGEVMRQCHESGVPFFMKQAGSNAHDPNADRIRYDDSAGADPSEWPTDLRVREFPA